MKVMIKIKEYNQLIARTTKVELTMNKTMQKTMNAKDMSHTINKSYNKITYLFINLSTKQAQ